VSDKGVPIRPRDRHVKFGKIEVIRDMNREPAGDEIHPVTDVDDVGEDEAQEALRRAPSEVTSRRRSSGT